jgi:hypothetical protein
MIKETAVDIRVDEIQEEELTSKGDYYALALFHGSGGDVSGMEFQRGVGGIYGHPDRGTPPYCTVTATQDTCCGGIDRVAWRDRSVVVDFSEEAATKLGLTDSRVTFTLDLADEDSERVRSGLRRVFAGGDFTYAQPELQGF